MNDKNTIWSGPIHGQNSLVNEIRDHYYGITDHLDPLIERLEQALFLQPDNALLRNELKIYKNMQEHMNNSELGRIL